MRISNRSNIASFCGEFAEKTSSSSMCLLLQQYSGNNQYEYETYCSIFLFATVPVEPAAVRGRVRNCLQPSADKSVKILRTWSATVRNYPQLSAASV